MYSSFSFLWIVSMAMLITRTDVFFRYIISFCLFFLRRVYLFFFYFFYGSLATGVTERHESLNIFPDLCRKSLSSYIQYRPISSTYVTASRPVDFTVVEPLTRALQKHPSPVKLLEYMLVLSCVQYMCVLCGMIICYVPFTMRVNP